MCIYIRGISYECNVNNDKITSLVHAKSEIRIDIDSYFSFIFPCSHACGSKRREKEKRRNLARRLQLWTFKIRLFKVRREEVGERKGEEGQLSSRSSSVAARAACVKYLPRFVSVHRRVSNHSFVLQCTGKSLFSYSMQLFSVIYRNKISLFLSLHVPHGILICHARSIQREH